MSEDFEFKDKWPQIDRILSQLDRLNDLNDAELEEKVRKLTKEKTDT